MRFDWTITVEGLAVFISAIGAIITAVFFAKEFRSSVKVKKADYLKELIKEIRSNNDISEILSLIDYGTMWYDDAFHQSGDFERKVDLTLSYFSYICYLWEEKLLSESEFKFFDYYLERILRNNNVRDYFYNLYHFALANGKMFSHIFLLNHGKKYFPKCYDEDFEDSAAWKRRTVKNGMVYHRILQF